MEKKRKIGCLFKPLLFGKERKEVVWDSILLKTEAGGKIQQWFPLAFAWFCFGLFKWEPLVFYPQ